MNVAVSNHDDRKALIAIGAVSALAFAFLVWLVYFNEARGPTPESVSMLPAVNATLNGASAVFIVLGYRFVRRRELERHRNAMVAAFACSTLFLVSYVIYHAYKGHTVFAGEGLIRPIYFFILITHIVLSAVALPLILTTFFYSLSRRFQTHRKVARWTLPLWLYVSVTGVLVFAILKTFNPA